MKTLKEDLRDELKPTIVEYTEKETNVPQKSSLKEKDQLHPLWLVV